MKKTILVGLGIAIAGASLLAGCGGGGGSPATGGATPQAIAAQGVYFGSYTINGQPASVPVFGAVLANGYAYFGDSDGALYVLPSGIKSGSFNGTLTAYAPIGEVFPTGQTIASFSLSGTVNDNGSEVTTINGSFSGADESGDFGLHYQAFSTNEPSLDSLAGTWQGYYWGSGSTSIVVTINADGTFSGNDGYGCSITGHISLVKGYDLIKATGNSTGNSTCVGQVTGLGFADTEDLSGLFGGVQGTYIYIGVSNDEAGFVAEIFK